MKFASIRLSFAVVKTAEFGDQADQMIFSACYAGDYADFKSISYIIIISKKSVSCVIPLDLHTIRLLPGIMKNGKMSYRSCEFSKEELSLQEQINDLQTNGYPVWISDFGRHSEETTANLQKKQ